MRLQFIQKNISQSQTKLETMIGILSKKLTPMMNICKLSTTHFSKDSPLFRQHFSPHTEEQLNIQIAQELYASQAYLAMANFFGRTEIALQGTSSFFRAMSCEERNHAFALIDYQNMRGGRVKMNGIVKPKDEFKEEYSDLSAAIEDSLLLERDNAEALMKLVHAAENDGDVVTVDFICSKFLDEQMSTLQSLGNILERLKQFEQKGLGEYFIDRQLQEKYPKNS